MNVTEVAPQIDPATLLAGAQFMDAFRLDVDGQALDARQAAMRMMARAPRWVDALVVLRNIMVAPFGLKTSGEDRRAPRDIIGIFPSSARRRSGWSRGSTTSISISASLSMSRHQGKGRASPPPRWC